MADLFQFPKICLHLSAVYLQFFKTSFKRILALQTLNLKCTVSELEPFTLVKKVTEHPVVIFHFFLAIQMQIQKKKKKKLPSLGIFMW